LLNYNKMKNILIITGLTFCVALTSCKKPEDNPTPTGPAYTVPTTYNYTDVDYTDDTTRIAMMTAIDAETNKGKDQTVSATVLKDMFANQNNQFTNSGLNTSGLQVKDHTDALAQAEVENFMDSIAKASLSFGTVYSDGVAGVATAGSGSKYLFAANGIEYRQVLSKFLMGTSLYHQIRNIYLADSSVGNAVDTATMKNNWDHAFGLFGVPVTFPTTVTGLKYLGNYSNKVNPGISSNATVMNAFLTGRAAINNNDLVTKEAQKLIIIAEIEQILAAAVIHELNAASSSTNISDVAARGHLISEALGFLLSLKYVGSSISDSQVDSIMANFPLNLYNITPQNITDAVDQLSAIYGLDSVKATL
jgi:hypothetical protein